MSFARISPWGRFSFLTVVVTTLLAPTHPVVAQTEPSEATTDTVVATPIDNATSTNGTPTTVGNPYRTETLVDDLVVGDFVLSPGKVEIPVNPGETKTINISVANRIGTEQVFMIDVEDIAASDDPEKAVALQGNRKGPYSLRDYVSIEQREFSLPHGKRAIVPITISVPADAEPSGHYGSVLVKTVTREANDGTEPGTAPSSAIVSRIGALFFVTVPGEVEVEGRLQAFATKNDQQWFSSGPVTFFITSENTGSIHLNPYGEIRITNLFGEEIGFVELQPWFVLPEAVRLREVTWNREVLFGRYTATLALNRGYNNEIDKAAVTFWVVPWQYLLGGLVGLFLLFVLIRIFFRTFEFQRKR